MKNKITIITNDAGGSEILLNLVLNEIDNFEFEIFTLKNSPASKLCTKYNLKNVNFNDLKELRILIIKSNPMYIIYGTGWQINFSSLVFDLSKEYNIKSIALLDHWTNYKQRFVNNCIPKNIFVTDLNAKKLARNYFPDKNIIQIDNYYLTSLIKKYKHTDNKYILFISEPTTTVAKKYFGKESAYGFTEYEVLEEILEKFDNILIRLHPSDEKNKYDYLVKKYFNKDIEIISSYSEGLVDTLSNSNLVIGFDGMALYISYILGIKTVSYMPNNKRKLSIPLPDNFLITKIDDISKIDFSMNEINNLHKDYIDFKKALKCTL